VLSGGVKECVMKNIVWLVLKVTSAERTLATWRREKMCGWYTKNEMMVMKVGVQGDKGIW